MTSGLQGILFDLDGVFYVGDQPIPGAAEVLDWAECREIPYLFVTNTTSRPRSALVEKLADLGIHTDADRILTPASAAAAWLRQHQRSRVAAFVPEATQAEFAEFDTAEEGSSDAVVVVGDLGEGWDFGRLNRAFRLLAAPGATLLALGMTRYWRATDGLRLDTGPFVRALEYASGKTAVVTGKPANDFFLSGASRLGLEPQELLMVGDDIRGDVDAAMQAGLAAAQVRSGKFTPADLELGISPTALFDTVADLPSWWEAQGTA